jgi:hypothetical protein
MNSRIGRLIMLFALAPLPALAAGADPVGDSPRSAWAVDWTQPAQDTCAPVGARAWRVMFDASEREPRSLVFAFAAKATDAAAAQRPTAFTYSESYHTRVTIHKYASVATLPLFIAQYAVGQKLYDGTGTDSTRSAHSALTVGLASLFALNSVTGVWNLMEGRKDPNGGTRRWVHALLMLAADAGFVATGALAPDDEGGEDRGEGGGGNRSLHRNVAITSMSLATVSYLIMLLPH